MRIRGVHGDPQRVEGHLHRFGALGGRRQGVEPEDREGLHGVPEGPAERGLQIHDLQTVRVGSRDEHHATTTGGIDARQGQRDVDRCDHQRIDGVESQPIVELRPR